MATEGSLISDSAGCYAATVVRPDCLVPRGKLVADSETRHQSAYSAQTTGQSLVINEPELANLVPNGLGRIFGQDELTIPPSHHPVNPRASKPVYMAFRSKNEGQLRTRALALDQCGRGSR